MYKGITMKFPNFDTPLCNIIKDLTATTRSEIKENMKAAAGYEETEEERYAKQAVKRYVIR